MKNLNMLPTRENIFYLIASGCPTKLDVKTSYKNNSEAEDTCFKIPQAELDFQGGLSWRFHTDNL